MSVRVPSRNVSTMKAALIIGTRRGISALVARRMRRGGADWEWGSDSSVIGIGLEKLRHYKILQQD